MGFDEPDVREAYRRGARDCFDSIANALNRRQAREIESWLDALDSWEHGDPPQPPVG